VWILFAACVSSTTASSSPQTQRQQSDSATRTAQQALTEYQDKHGKPVQEATGAEGPQGVSDSFIPAFVMDMVKKQSSQNSQSPQISQSPQKTQSPQSQGPAQSQNQLPYNAEDCKTESELVQWKDSRLQQLTYVPANVRSMPVKQTMDAFKTQLAKLRSKDSLAKSSIGGAARPATVESAAVEPTTAALHEQRHVPPIPQLVKECNNELELDMWRAQELEKIRQNFIPEMQPSAVMAVKRAYDNRLSQIKLTAAGEHSQLQGPPPPLSAVDCKTRKELWNWRASVLSFVSNNVPIAAQQRTIAHVMAEYKHREQELDAVTDQTPDSQRIPQAKQDDSSENKHLGLVGSAPKSLAGQPKSSNGQHVLALGFLCTLAFFVPAAGAWLHGLLGRRSHAKLEQDHFLPLDDLETISA